MSEMTSKYTIDLVVNDDKTRDSLRQIKDSLSNITSGVSTSEIEKEFLKMSKNLSGVISDTTERSAKALNRFSKDTRSAIGALETQYTTLKTRQESVQSEYERLTEELKRQKEIHASEISTDKMKIDAANEVCRLTEIIKNHEYLALESDIAQNRETRRRLKTLELTARNTNTRLKYEEKTKGLAELTGRLEKAQNENKRKFLKFIAKSDTDEIKALKEKIKLMQDEERQEKKICQIVEKSAKEQDKTIRDRSRFLQDTYNIAGLLGGAGRTVKGIGQGIYGAGKMAAVGMKAGVGMLGAGLSAATQAADREVEKEHQANRIKGFSGNEAKNVLNEMYIRTGADYSQIVDAINRVQTTLKGAAKDEILSAAEIEMRYPGMSAAFSSTNTASNAGNFNIYANRMKAIQKATGATDEQIQSSTQMFANMKPSDFGNAKVTELQAVYLGLQGSGAFDSQDELDAAFNRFIKKQKNSSESVAESARKFNWSEGIRNDRNKTQAQNTVQGMDWSEIVELTKTKDSSEMQKTESEQMAANMRRMEEQKNKLLMTLIPAAIPLVEAFAKMLDGGGAKLIADGLNSLFTLVVPVLLKVLNMLNDYILTPLLKAINAVVEWIGDKSGVDTGAVPQNANGGIAIGPSVVGERAFQPEMILPLDYSRSSRAGNIIQNVAQTFNMSGSETTALSLAQAVKSRDFRRATSQNAFITARSGAF